MNLIINHSSMEPIYEQIMSQIKELIIHGKLIEGTGIPSVRTLVYLLLYSIKYLFTLSRKRNIKLISKTDPNQSPNMN